MMVGAPLLKIYIGPNATNLSECDPAEATRLKQIWILRDLEASCPLREKDRPGYVSPSCWDFMRCMLMPGVESRASVEDALRHVWLTSHGWFAPPASAPLASWSAATPQEEQWTPGRVQRQASGGSATSSVAISEPISNVPTPLKPRSWDSSRNMAYSPPVGTPAEEHSAAKSSPARQHEQSPLVERRSKSPARASPPRAVRQRQPRQCLSKRNSAPPSASALEGDGARFEPTALPGPSPTRLFSVPQRAEAPPAPAPMPALMLATAPMPATAPAPAAGLSCAGPPPPQDPLSQTTQPTSSRHHDPARDVLLVTAPARCVDGIGKRSVSPLRPFQEIEKGAATPNSALARPRRLSARHENVPPSNVITTLGMKHLEPGGAAMGKAAAGIRMPLEARADLLSQPHAAGGIRMPLEARIDPLSQTQAVTRASPVLRKPQPARLSAPAAPGQALQQRCNVPLQPWSPQTYLVAPQVALPGPLPPRTCVR